MFFKDREAFEAYWKNKLQEQISPIEHAKRIYQFQQACQQYAYLLKEQTNAKLK